MLKTGGLYVMRINATVWTECDVLLWTGCDLMDSQFERGLNMMVWAAGLHVMAWNGCYCMDWISLRAHSVYRH